MAGNAKAIVTVSLITTGVVVVISHAKKGEFPPPPRTFLALGFVFVVLTILADTEPKLAAPLAGLVVVGTVVTDAGGVFDAIGNAVSGKTKLGRSTPNADSGATTMGGVAPMAGSASASPQAIKAVNFARGAEGLPYVWGGEGPGGYDCSGLCQAAYSAAGVSIPRTTWEQVKIKTKVAKGAFAPGDLLFSNWEGGTDATHVVMYKTSGTVISADHTGTFIKEHPVEQFTGSEYRGAVRPAPITTHGIQIPPSKLAVPV